MDLDNIGLISLAAVLQVGALSLILWRVRRRWLAHAGFIFLAMCLILHGACEIANASMPGLNSYRTLISTEAVQSWLLLISAFIFLFAVSYVYTLGKPLESPQPSDVHPGNALGVLDWRILLPAIVPVFILAVSGTNVATMSYWGRGLVSTVLVLAIVAGTITFLIWSENRFFLAAVFVQSLALSLLGQRLNIVFGLIALLSTLSRYHLQPEFRKSAAAFAWLGVLVISISTARILVGRDMFQVGNASERMSAIGTGAAGLKDNQVESTSIARDFVYRIDGNAFPSMVNQRYTLNTSMAGFAPIASDLLVAVPEFLFPAKHDFDVLSDGSKLMLNRHFVMPEGIDFLPMLTGVIYACSGTYGLLISAILLGIFFAKVDRWLNLRISPSSLLVSVGLSYVVIFSEQGFKVYAITFRTIFLILVFVTVVNGVLRSLKARQGHHTPLAKRRVAGQ